MEELILFILGTAGLTWTLVKSKLFKRFREYLTKRNDLYELLNKSIEKTVSSKITGKILWALDSLFGCSGCMGLYSGAITYILVYTYHFRALNYALSGIIISLILISFINFLERK